jgi:hypothetical protein
MSIWAQLGLPDPTPDELADLHKCEQCGHSAYDKTTGEVDNTTRSCADGHCTEWHCAGCDRLIASAGPLGCPCQEGEQ